MLDQIISSLAQIAFFPFSVAVFGRLDRATATAVVVLSGLLFLPAITIFYLSDAVPITKDKIIFLGALFGFIVHQRPAFLRSRPVMVTTAVLIPLTIVNILSLFENMETVYSQGAFHQGLGFAWLLGQTIDDFFVIALPFLIGKAAFISYRDLRTLLYVLVGMGIVYSAIAIFELVMAIPFRVFQFSEIIYGLPFRPMFRYGLTEPAAFMGGGHILSMFFALTLIAAAGFNKIGKPVSWLRLKKARIITGAALMSTLKVGGIFLGLSGAMLFSFFKPRTIAFIAFFSASVLCVYPLMQTFDMISEDVLVEIAAEYTNEDRARSFAGRFHEEDFVIDQLGGRWLSGWGTFARIPGADGNIGPYSGEGGLDAWWVIKLGHSGILGVEVVLFLFAIPIWQARRRIASIQSDEIIILMSALMMCIVIRMADLMLNGWWNSLPIFLAGALYGICKLAHLQSADENPSLDDEQQKK